jgi:hypothetical protein
MLIRDHTRTTYNLYGDGVVKVKLGGASHWTQADALRNYCSAYRKQEPFDGEAVVDLGCEKASPRLARVFFQAISPFLRGSLPTHDFVQNPEKDLSSEGIDQYHPARSPRAAGDRLGRSHLHQDAQARNRPEVSANPRHGRRPDSRDLPRTCEDETERELDFL